MPVYRVTHTTSYQHDSPASAAWQSLHLQPRHEAVQHCNAFELEIAPHPLDLAARVDYFGNKQHIFTLREPHEELTITSRSVVRRDEPVLPMPGLTPSLADARALIPRAIAAEDFTLDQFRHGSPLVPLLPEALQLTAELTADLDPASTPVLTWLTELGEQFHDAFTFDSEATDISTPLAEVIENRRGVCQDFAHLLISCLRQNGLPAGYVSGYLLTNPPPGKPRLVGADASHAWVSVYIPGTGWVDYDPTNACFVGTGHIVVARGRDFYDVSPVKGLFSGGGDHSLDTGVTVEPADEISSGANERSART
ncbi:MAG TPA: transglutaminase family protein [Opitutaceae bacterium]|nr:transglutaminase family protein [Opitutaceae bacterium]